MKERGCVDFINSLEKVKLPALYHFRGSEKAFKEIAVGKIKKTLSVKPRNFVRTHVKNAPEVLAQALTPGIFSETRLAVVEEAEKAGAALLSELKETLSSAGADACVIISSDLDRKNEGLERVLENAETVNFFPLSRETVREYAAGKLAEKSLKTTDAALDAIVELSNFNAMLVDREIEKISAWAAVSESVTDGEVMDCLGFDREVNPFELSNAITDLDKKKAVETMNSLLNSGAEPLHILRVIMNVLDKMLKVKIYAEAGGKDFYKSGMSRGQFFYLSKKEKNFSVKALKKNIVKCIEAEAALKSSGAPNPNILLKQIIYSVMGSTKRD